MLRRRTAWLTAFFLLLAAEILIALFVRDRFIRPYGGDILVTVLLCCFVRIFVPQKWKTMPLWVFLFSVAVEVGQYFHYADILGLGDNPFFRTLLGTSFSWADIICYAVGCAVFIGCEAAVNAVQRQDDSAKE